MEGRLALGYGAIAPVAIVVCVSMVNQSEARGQVKTDQFSPGKSFSLSHGRANIGVGWGRFHRSPGVVGADDTVPSGASMRCAHRGRETPDVRLRGIGV